MIGSTREHSDQKAQLACAVYDVFTDFHCHGQTHPAWPPDGHTVGHFTTSTGSTVANDSHQNKSEAILLIFRPAATGIARQGDFPCWLVLSRLLLCCYVLLFVTFTCSSNTRLHTGCNDQSPCNLILGRSKDKVRNIAKIWSLGHYHNFLHFLILQAIKQKHRL